MSFLMCSRSGGVCSGAGRPSTDDSMPTMCTTLSCTLHPGRSVGVFHCSSVRPVHIGVRLPDRLEQVDELLVGVSHTSRLPYSADRRVHDRARPRHHRLEQLVGVVAQRGDERRLLHVGHTLDLLAVLAAGVGEAAVGVDEPPAAEAVERGPDLVGRSSPSIRRGRARVRRRTPALGQQLDLDGASPAAVQALRCESPRRSRTMSAGAPQDAQRVVGPRQGAEPGEHRVAGGRCRLRHGPQELGRAGEPRAPRPVPAARNAARPRDGLRGVGAGSVAPRLVDGGAHVLRRHGRKQRRGHRTRHAAQARDARRDSPLGPSRSGMNQTAPRMASARDRSRRQTSAIRGCQPAGQWSPTGRRWWLRSPRRSGMIWRSVNRHVPSARSNRSW